MGGGGNYKAGERGRGALTWRNTVSGFIATSTYDAVVYVLMNYLKSNFKILTKSVQKTKTHGTVSTYRDLCQKCCIILNFEI